MTPKTIQAVATAAPAYKTIPTETLKSLVLATIDDMKGEETEIIDLQAEDYITDYMIVSTGRSSRQVMSMADKIREQCLESGHTLVRMEGGQTGDWIVVDLGDIIVHLFRPEVRTFYNIERMWRDRNSAGPNTPHLTVTANTEHHH
ncbi:MAG: ribosome silencing factor [Pseudomonadota bacterium]